MISLRTERILVGLEINLTESLYAFVPPKVPVKVYFLESLPKRSHTKISDTCSIHCNNVTVHMYYSMSLCLCMYANHYQSSARCMH